MECAAFYYSKGTTGHGWDGDYEEIIRIFCNSAYDVGITPIHIRLPHQKALTEVDLCIEVSVALDELIYIRELGYLEALKCAKSDIILCDPDQVFIRPIPTLKKQARLTYRENTDAAFNGPRMLSKACIPMLEGTIKRLDMMKKKYRIWDGDSMAFRDSVNAQALIGLKLELAYEGLYFSRPSLGADSSSYMYHFKGKAAKQEMLDYAKENGLL